MDKQIVVYPYNEIVLNNLKNIDSGNKDESQNNYAVYNKPEEKREHKYMYIYLKFWDIQINL